MVVKGAQTLLHSLQCNDTDEEWENSVGAKVWIATSHAITSVWVQSALHVGHEESHDGTEQVWSNVAEGYSDGILDEPRQ